MNANEVFTTWLRSGATQRSLDGHSTTAALFEFSADPEVGTTPDIPMHLEEKAYAFSSTGRAKASIDLWYLPEPSPHFEVSHVLWKDGDDIPTLDDITGTPLGLTIVKSYEALHAKFAASLPKTKEEWAEWQRLMDERIRKEAERQAANPTPRLTEDEIWARL